ncbi:hypothetical protein AK830_g802 [Neonectria ditissima]|uniref:Amino acid transporter transmembrane domain-containing protein n=1 Tax=Neonectria ditissima TaxID=78410 RepID=A0A0N8H8W6_9HYPO|nr:hypothetical protein AK830_g802 [Neonectria ditissima]
MSLHTGIAAGGDPHLSLSKNEAFIAEQPFDAHDPSITFEEFMYWAKITRLDELAANQAYIEGRGPRSIKTTIKDRFSKGDNGLTVNTNTPSASGNEDNTVITSVSDQEWKQASRALRTAGWGAIFYLITTDILGPFSTPWSFAQMGYGPGIALYTVFGGMAGYSGWIMWKAYLGLDSDKYPLRTYGDLFFRVFGKIPRHMVNFMLGLQMLLFVAVLILSNGQSISQISQGNNNSNGNGLCFVVCLIIFMASGFVLGQIRTLQRFAWLSNFAVWINLLIIFICMGVVVHSPPNFRATKASFGDTFGPGPIKTYAGTPPAGMASGGVGFVASLNGLSQAVYSYGGCMTFVSFLAEMRHPMDFWKGLLVGQTFIYCVYMFFGLFVYSYQGQYAFNPVMQGLSPYRFQTATNIMNLVTGLIAAALYSNIGFKVVYIEVLQEIFNFPPLTKKSGKIAWAISIPLYWAFAFIIAAAIPQFSSISSLIGAFFILSFTYTFPAILAMGYWIRKDAMLPEERFDPQTRVYNYVDSGFSRWKRGFMKKPLMNAFNLFYMLGGMATTGLGVYSAIKGLISAFSGNSVATSFGCTPPV